MIKSFVLPAALLGGLLLSGMASAEQKIVSFRAAAVVQGWPQFRTAQMQLKTELERRKAELDAEAKRINEDEQKFGRESLAQGEAERKKAMQDLSNRKIDLQYKADQFQKDAQKRGRELEDTLLTKIRDTVEQVAKEKSASMVVQDPVYVDPSLDITDEVVKRLAASK